MRKLRYFAGVVEAKSMSRAAAALHVAQPALSKSLKSLEQDLGASLLQRSPQGVIATEAGERLYEHCQILFKQLDRARFDVLRTAQRPSGLVSVGMPHSLMAVLALALLQTATEHLPEVRLELKQEQSHNLAVAVRANKLDLAIAAEPRTQAGLQCQPLLTEELYLIESRRLDDDSTSEPISFREASKRKFVLPTIGNGLRSYVEGHFRARLLALDVRYETDAIALIPRCVISGLGASILPGGCLQHDPAVGSLRLRTFDEGGCKRRLVICHSEAAQPSPACERVIHWVRRCAASLIEAGGWLGGSLDPALVG